MTSATGGGRGVGVVGGWGVVSGWDVVEEDKLDMTSSMSCAIMD